jgi:hypothetical protein
MLGPLVGGSTFLAAVKLKDEERLQISGRAIWQEELYARLCHGGLDQCFERTTYGLFLAVLGDDLDRDHEAFIQVGTREDTVFHRKHPVRTAGSRGHAARAASVLRQFQGSNSAIRLAG